MAANFLFDVPKTKRAKTKSFVKHMNKDAKEAFSIGDARHHDKKTHIGVYFAYEVPEGRFLEDFEIFTNPPKIDWAKVKEMLLDAYRGDELANVLKLKAAYLHNKFRQRHGMSIKEYVDKVLYMPRIKVIGYDPTNTAEQVERVNRHTRNGYHIKETQKGVYILRKNLNPRTL